MGQDDASSIVSADTHNVQQFGGCNISIFRNNGKSKLLNLWELVKSNYKISSVTNHSKVDQPRKINAISRDDCTAEESYTGAGTESEESHFEDELSDCEHEYDIAYANNVRESEVFLRRE